MKLLLLANGHLRNTSNGQYLLCGKDITLLSVGRTTHRVSKVKVKKDHGFNSMLEAPGSLKLRQD